MIKTTHNRSGFTIVEILIVIIVIGILVAISVVSYNAVQNRAKTSAGEALATQVANKVDTFYKYKHTYPTVAQLTATTPLVPEAKVDDPSSIGTPTTTAQKQKATYKDGTYVTYRLASASTACVVYWDYQADTYQVILFGPSHPHCT